MMRLFLLIMVFTFVSGCILAPPPAPNEPPAAYIDSVSAARISPGEMVTFAGHGIDNDGSIAAYSWRSSIDGELSTSASFSTSSLSQGSHTIWFKVQDNSGAWSKEVSCHVVVLPSGLLVPVISLFEANPPTISRGESATLRWDVSGAAAVKIEPNVGNVALAGNRVVFPTKTTVYTLTATNQSGAVTATTGVAVLEVPLHTVELFSIAAEDGHVRRDGMVGPEPKVGDTITDVAMQAFLSFDISSIPKGATIRSAALDLTPAEVHGSPFTMLGRLYLYHCHYSQLGKRDFVIGIAPSAVLYTTSAMLAQPISSSQLVNAIQSQVDAGSNRFQVRLQFEKQTSRYHVADYLELRSDEARLVVRYED
ncbi:MAG TPA: hypothetical protein EYP71_07225 [Dehalococcoidia bacterium]|nr:hypothetical protein [Dehalococcoidia bacterium]